jgi:hypothetical protein
VGSNEGLVPLLGLEIVRQACANQARRDHRPLLEHDRLDLIAIVFCRIFGLRSGTRHVKVVYLCFRKACLLPVSRGPWSCAYPLRPVRLPGSASPIEPAVFKFRNAAGAPSRKLTTDALMTGPRSSGVFMSYTHRRIAR